MKKGFTLIELLAVIVILAVIALVAVPSIMGIITKAKRGAAENSAYNYVKALETSVVTSQLNGDNLTGHYDVIELEDKVLLKGTKPSKGNVTLANTGKVETATLCINNFEIIYNGTYAKVVADNCNSEINYIMSRPIEDSYFWHYTYRSKIKSIAFVNYTDIPYNAVEYWDLSEKQDDSIIGWLIPNAEQSWYYDLYIGSEGKIYANPDSSNWFYDLYNVNSINFNNYDTSNVTNMANMFSNMTYLTTLNLNSFDTSNVTNMSNMFSEMYNLTTLDLSSFDTSNVTNMIKMFMYDGDLQNLNISSFNTSNVTTAAEMFCLASKLTNLDISHFDTSKMIDSDKLYYCSYIPQ